MSMNVSTIILFVGPATQYAVTFGPKIFQAIFSLATYRPVTVKEKFVEKKIKDKENLCSENLGFLAMHCQFLKKFVFIDGICHLTISLPRGCFMRGGGGGGQCQEKGFMPFYH